MATNRFFALYGFWEGLVWCKILPQGVGTICPYFWEVIFFCENREVLTICFGPICDHSPHFWRGLLSFAKFLKGFANRVGITCCSYHQDLHGPLNAKPSGRSAGGFLYSIIFSTTSIHDSMNAINFLFNQHMEQLMIHEAVHISFLLAFAFLIAGGLAELAFYKSACFFVKTSVQLSKPNVETWVETVWFPELCVALAQLYNGERKLLSRTCYWFLVFLSSFFVSGNVSSRQGLARNEHLLSTAGGSRDARQFFLLLSQVPFWKLSGETLAHPIHVPTPVPILSPPGKAPLPTP